MRASVRICFINTFFVIDAALCMTDNIILNMTVLQ
jgi:hypothetical protein